METKARKDPFESITYYTGQVERVGTYYKSYDDYSYPRKIKYGLAGVILFADGVVIEGLVNGRFTLIQPGDVIRINAVREVQGMCLELCQIGETFVK